MENTDTAIVLSDSISICNPIFSGVYNLAVKIRVLLKFGTVLSQIGSDLSFFSLIFFHSFPLFNSLNCSNNFTTLTDISCFFAPFFIFKILFFFLIQS